MLFSPSLRANEVAFLYALAADRDALINVLEGEQVSVSVGDRVCTRIRSGSLTVYAMEMRAGCVESAVSTASLLARFPCDWLVSVGPVGALSPATLELGDFGRIESVVYGPAAGPEGPGEPVVVPGEGLPEVISELSGTEDNLPLWCCVSGERFIARAAEADDLNRRFGATVVDMNLAGVLAACQSHGLPNIHWRVVSDRADESAREDFRAFVGTYDGGLGRQIGQRLLSLPPDPEAAMSYPSLERLIDQGVEGTEEEN